MTDRESEQRTILESEMIFGVRRRERLAWMIAGGSILVASLCAGALALAMPMKETQAFLTIVDKDTGLAERAVQIEAATMAQRNAVEQSLLFNYVMDRETYDQADNQARIVKVYRMSAPRVQQNLQALWAKGNPSNPQNIYGQRGKATVEIQSISQIRDGVAMVRFTKRVQRDNQSDRVARLNATITYEFNPTRQTNAKLVWENPFGFTVMDYRVNPETMEAQQ